MKKTVFTLGLILIVFVLQAQKMFEQQFNNCPLKFVLEDEEYLINYAPNDSVMVLDFLQGLEEKQIAKLKGAVMVQVMIDTAFNICCVSYTNKTTISDKKLDIPNRIKQMKGWERLPNCNAEENICALISMVFDKSEITVIRTAYNRNRGRRIINSAAYARFASEPDSTKTAR